MRVPLFWLHDYCDPGLEAAALADRLTMTGTKVERVLTHGVTALDRFVVGRVLTAEKHPDADRLSVCTVDVGNGAPAQIVCGAPNVAAGQTVAVARPGAVMPDGTTLGAAKLRGVESQGMILAEDEVAIGTDHDGIMVLDAGAAPGTPLAEVLPIATDVLELEITPNRPDCLGLYGVAREVHAATGAPLGPPPWAQDPGKRGEVSQARVEVEVPELCPRFTARVFEGVRIGPSPAWLKARLMAAGQRPINNVVDITNYVMLVSGQPLHAFDLDRVAGGRLIVRRARDGETIETLDGAVRKLDQDIVLICDDEGPTSIAGVMGGARSEVSPDTSRVLMEAATWDGPNIQRTSTRLGLRSEASGRFEKGLSAGQTMEAQAVASTLMVELCGATLRGGTIDVGGPGPAPEVLRLRSDLVEKLLGREISLERCSDILRSLGFTVEIGTGSHGLAAAGAADRPGVLVVDVPHFRARDVTREVDLIEEVARIDGLEKLPATLPSLRRAGGRLTPLQRLRRRADDALLGAGLDEIAGWSFVAPDSSTRLRAPDGAIRVRNPLSEDQALLRTTLLGSLLDAARFNLARDAAHVRLFERGAVFLPGGPDGLADEPERLAALITGPVRRATWREPEPPAADFFAAKGVLATVLDALRVPWAVEAAEEPFLHPGRSARVLVDGQPAGWLGEIHPLVAGDWDLPGASGFEIDFGAVAAAAPAALPYQDLTSFPEVRQDLAVEVPTAVPAARVVEVAQRAGAPTLARAEVFDVYPLDAERRSLALHLTFRAPDRTLTDADVAEVRTAILAALRGELGAEPRGG